LVTPTGFVDVIKYLIIQEKNWSGREDSNFRPLPPEGSTLPG
jgi:hypothetical protein